MRENIIVSQVLPRSNRFQVIFGHPDKAQIGAVFLPLPMYGLVTAPPLPPCVMGGSDNEGGGGSKEKGGRREEGNGVAAVKRRVDWKGSLPPIVA